MRPDALYHFSSDPGIERFVPHVPATNASHRPAVWAIDAAHSPLYWFPRDCPRVTVWSSTPAELVEFGAGFTTTASRLHAIESAWFARMRDASIYRYELDPGAFTPWEEASGQWISEDDVVPVSMSPILDLLMAHVDAAIELRVVPSLWPLHDEVRHGKFDFSLVRMRNAQPRSSP